MVELEKEHVNEFASRILDQLARVIVGKREAGEKLLISLLSEGHVLIEDYPGLGKTLLARSFATLLGLQFKRIQFTSDLLPADITGSFVFDRNRSSFTFRRGPIFANVVLADEVNRAPPRTQSALLEAMQEKQVTVEDETFQLPRPFMVIATQNPIEYEGTYPLPEAQVDRFLLKLSLGYPSEEEEVRIAKLRHERMKDEVELQAVTGVEELTKVREEVERVHIDESLLRYITELVRRTRLHKDVEVGSSPRGVLALLKLSKSFAWLHSRNFVLPDDVKAMAVEALAHRLILKPEKQLRGVNSASIIKEVLSETPVPKVD